MARKGAWRNLRWPQRGSNAQRQFFTDLAAAGRRAAVCHFRHDTAWPAQGVQWRSYTLELDDTVFKNAEGMEKVAMLVRSFIQMGGHQMQLNAVNRETLLDAQKNPQDHQDLIVRVWGWSGHFVQLDKGYQDQIIQRTSYREA